MVLKAKFTIVHKHGGTRAGNVNAKLLMEAIEQCYEDLCSEFDNQDQEH